MVAVSAAQPERTMSKFAEMAVNALYSLQRQTSWCRCKSDKWHAINPCCQWLIIQKRSWPRSP